MQTEEFTADEWQIWLTNEMTIDYMDKLKNLQQEELTSLSLCSSYEDYLRRDGRYLMITDVIDGAKALGEEVKK